MICPNTKARLRSSLERNAKRLPEELEALLLSRTHVSASTRWAGFQDLISSGSWMPSNQQDYTGKCSIKMLTKHPIPFHELTGYWLDLKTKALMLYACLGSRNRPTKNPLCLKAEQMEKLLSQEGQLTSDGTPVSR